MCQVDSEGLCALLWSVQKGTSWTNLTAQHEHKSLPPDDFLGFKYATVALAASSPSQTRLTALPETL